MYQHVKSWKTCLGLNRHIIKIVFFLGRHCSPTTKHNRLWLPSQTGVHPPGSENQLGLVGCDRERSWCTGRNNKLGLFVRCCVPFSKCFMLVRHSSLCKLRLNVSSVSKHTNVTHIWLKRHDSIVWDKSDLDFTQLKSNHTVWGQEFTERQWEDEERREESLAALKAATKISTDWNIWYLKQGSCKSTVNPLHSTSRSAALRNFDI